MANWELLIAFITLLAVLVTALVSFDRVFEILDLEPLITERPTPYPLPGATSRRVWR